MIKNITLSADEALIAKARKMALKEKTSLNSLFRKWMERYTGKQRSAQEYLKLMNRLEYADSGGSFSREEMNAREKINER